MGYENRELLLSATGDSLVTRRLSVHNEKGFLDLVHLLRQGDVTFTNLETLLHDYEGYAAAESGGTWMTSPPYIAEELKWAGINIVSRANNHAMDYGPTGMRVTSSYLDKARIVHAGVGESLSDARSPAYMETKGGRVALISVTTTFPTSSIAGESRHGIPPRPGVNPLRHSAVFKIDQPTAEKLKEIASRMHIKVRNVTETEFTLFGERFRISDKSGPYDDVNNNDLNGNLRAIREAKAQADYVFVSLHAHEGKEDCKPDEDEREMPADFVRDFARACIDAGADAVIGHGPEVLRGVELHKGKPIFYSLGCFFLQNDTVNRHPADIYEKYGLDTLATPADLNDIREVKGFLDGNKWFTHESVWWEGALAHCTYDNKSLKKLTLYPVSLGFGESRARRGRPLLASSDHARRIMERIKKLSASFNTEIDFEDGVGNVRL